jgi:Tfp pilus assembly ATPase PilU
LARPFGQVATPVMRKLIRAGESRLMINEIQMGKKFQMQSMDMALVDLYHQGEITYDTATYDNSMSCARDQIRSGIRRVDGPTFGYAEVSASASTNSPLSR